MPRQDVLRRESLHLDGLNVPLPVASESVGVADRDEKNPRVSFTQTGTETHAREEEAEEQKTAGTVDEARDVDGEEGVEGESEEEGEEEEGEEEDDDHDMGEVEVEVPPEGVRREMTEEEKEALERAEGEGLGGDEEEDTFELAKKASDEDEAERLRNKEVLTEDEKERLERLEGEGLDEEDETNEEERAAEETKRQQELDDREGLEEDK